MGEWNARSRIRLRSFYLLLRMHRCGQGSVRSEAGPEGKRASLSLSLRTTLSLSLSLFSTRSRSTTNRRRLVICFHTFAGICQSTPLSPPSGSRCSPPFILPFRILSLSHLRQWPANRPHITSCGTGTYFSFRDTDGTSRGMRNSEFGGKRDGEEHRRRPYWRTETLYVRVQ